MNLPVHGGQYRATVYPDGSADLHDIPCFAECKARTNGQWPPFDVTRPWLEAAFRNHEAWRGGGFVPPAHTKHHYDSNSTGRAGFYWLTGVRPAIESGQRKFALYTDLLRIPAAVFAQIERGEWPYCSVEVGDWNRAIINSLALLDDEAPAHKFPLISVGQKIQAGAAASPARFAASRDAGSVRFRFAAFSQGQGAAVMDPNQMPPGLPAPAAPPPAQMAAPAAAPAAPAAPAAAPAPQTVGQMAPEAFAALIVQAIKSSIGEDEQNTEPDNEPPAAEPDDLGGDSEDNGGSDDDGPSQFAAAGATPELAAQMAAMRAELNSLRGEQTKRKRADVAAARFSAARAELAEFELDSETVADLQAFAAMPDNGASLNRFVAAFKRVGVQDPPESLEAAGFGAGRMDPPEVAAFAQQGPERLARARAFHPAWKALQARGGQSNFETFLAAQDEARVANPGNANRAGGR